MAKKKTKSWKDLTEKEQEEAKQLFMEYNDVKAIALKFGVPRTTISYHSNKYWNPEREMLKAELFTKFAATKRKDLIETSQYSIKILKKALGNLANREEAPTTREAKDTVTILEALDKITRLDDGNPTEITGEKVMEFTDIEAIANLVPFKTKPKIVENEEIEQVVYKEEKNETKD